MSVSESSAIVQTTSIGSPMTELSSLPPSGFPFLGVDRRRRWGPGLLRPTVDHQKQKQRPNSPVLIVCEDDGRSDYDDDDDSEDSEANNSDRSERYGPRPPPPHRHHPVKGGSGPGRKSVKLCVPVARVVEPTSAGRCSDQGCSAGDEYSLNYSSDCRSDEEYSQKSGWNDIPTVSDV